MGRILCVTGVHILEGAWGVELYQQSETWGGIVCVTGVQILEGAWGVELYQNETWGGGGNRMSNRGSHFRGGMGLNFTSRAKYRGDPMCNRGSHFRGGMGG